MSKFSDNIQTRQERSQDRKSCKRELGKFCYDMAKITYTAMGIGCIIPMITGNDPILYGVIAGGGMFITVIFACLGYKFNSFN
jgi:hypothetical protein